MRKPGNIREEGKKFRASAGRAFSPSGIAKLRRDWEREAKKERVLITSLVTDRKVRSG